MLDGYIRVSQVGGRSGEGFISPSVQRQQIIRYAEAHGLVLGEIYEELDESGGRRDRPLLLRALARIENRESEGLIVARLDRFGRSLIDGLSAIERIRAADGVFVSAQDGLDLRTDTGKLVLRIMLSMAEWELDRIRTQWITARERATARGVHLGRNPPFGYQRGPDGRLRPDPHTGPVLKEVFKRRSQGATDRELCEWLEREGIRTARGYPGWAANSLRVILRNRVYLGELKSGDFVARGTHAPLVDRVTWQDAQEAPFPTRRKELIPTLLGGILRCSECRMALHSQTVTRNGGRKTAAYACHGRSGQGRCPAPAYVTGPIVEPLVEEAFFGELERPFGTGSPGRLASLHRAVDKAEASLDSFRDDPRIEEAIGRARYYDGLRVRKQQIDAAMRDLARERRSLKGEQLPTAEQMASAWPYLTIEERRAALAEVVECVFVDRGWSQIEDRTYVCLRGHAPDDLPRRGARRVNLKRFDPGSVRQLRLRRPRRWTNTRIKSELQDYVGARTLWPATDEFLNDGRGPLYCQVLRSGGTLHWSRKLGVRARPSVPSVRAWNRELAIEALVEFGSQRSVQPTERGLQEAGLGGLCKWLQENGGLKHWRRELSRMDEVQLSG